MSAAAQSRLFNRVRTSYRIVHSISLLRIVFRESIAVLLTYNMGKSLILAVVGCLCVCGLLEAAPQIGQLVDIETEIDSIPVTTEEPSTTTDPYAKLAAAFTFKTPTQGKISYSAGVHRFEIGPDEDPQQRVLQEYRDKFELRLPTTTARYPKGPPCVYC